MAGRFLLAVVAVKLAMPACLGADPQPYSINIGGTGDGQVDAAIQGTSLLSSLRTSVPAAPFALVDRAMGDIGRFQTVLEGFGYYKASVAITIDGRDIGDRNLPALLEKVPQGQSVKVDVSFKRGPQYHLRDIAIEGEVPAQARAVIGIKPGDSAIAANVIAAQASLTTALEEEGYAFAKVDTPQVFADDAHDALDVTFKVETGNKAKIGAISLKGLQRMNESFVRDALTVHSGDPYKPSAVESARQELIKLGVFSGVSVRAADHPDSQGNVPLTFDMQERPRHAVALSASYSTDLGGSLSASWTDRNLLGNAEQLSVSAAGTGLGGTATAGIGYTFLTRFIKPDFMQQDQQLEADVGGVKQNLDAYSQLAETIGASLRRKFSPLWTGSVGLTATHDQITQEGVTRLYPLISVPISAIYDSTGLIDPLSDPSHGLRGSVTLTPEVAFGKYGQVFAVLQAAASTYFDFSTKGRSVLALRALVGSIVGGNTFDLPPDQRFYAGGSGTVRGFRYQSIGPHFADGKPIGAAAVDAASVEFRQRILSDWGAAVFVDAGQASAGNTPFYGALEVGAGVGVRYYTPVGAVRLDAAMPLTHVPLNDAFEVYISIGQAF
ncbi:MAG: BamA/TamA family outer membrane protein [Alphaproteobacteria bacterium]|nr:BamA/TamA family outer membrane protein [Alphaproteobacteria bacterium]